MKIKDSSTGKTFREIPLACNHYYHMTCKLPNTLPLVVETCQECEEVRVYNIHTFKQKVVLKQVKVSGLCEGPKESLLLMTVDGAVLHLEWIENEERFCTVGKFKVPTTAMKITKMCYIKQHHILVYILNKGIIIAVNLSNGFILWGTLTIQ